MQKWIYFGVGVVTGIVLTFIIAIAISPKSSNSAIDNGATWFDKPGDVMETPSFKVFQSLSEGYALANAHEGYSEDSFYGPICLLTNEDGKFYYDDEIVKVPEGKEARQVGIYRYQSRNEMERTVPIIMILDK